MTEGVVEFEGRGVLQILHNSFRFQGGNSFQLPIDPALLFGEENSEEASNYDDFDPTDPGSFSQLLDSEQGQYYAGSLTASIIILILLFLWCICLPFSRCCCKAKADGNKWRLVVFFVTLNLSIIGWFLSLTGYGYLVEGLNTFSSNSNEVNTDLKGFLTQIDAIVATGPELDALKLTAEADCEDLISNLTAAGFNVEVDFNLIPGSVELNEVIAPKEEVEDVPEEIDDIISLVEEESESIKGTYEVFISFLIIFLVIFNITTIISFFCRNSDGCLASLSKCLNKVGCVLMFTIGLFFVTFAVIIVALFAPVATVGSDACTPDLVTTVRQQVDLALVNENVADFCLLADFDNLSENEQIGWFACHYTECRGENILFETAGITLVNGEFESLDVVEDLLVQLEFAEQALTAAADGGFAGGEECNAAVNVGFEVRDLLLALIEEGVNFAACETVAPLIAETANESVCNGLVAGIAVIYITWFLGIVSLMVALFVYIQLDFKADEKENDNEGPPQFAYAFAEEIDVNNPRFSSGKYSENSDLAEPIAAHNKFDEGSDDGREPSIRF